MNLTRTARTVAEQILWLRRGTATTPLHINKLVYLSHGWMLGRHGRPLIDESVEAWKYGPIVPSIYYVYKAFRMSAITTEPADWSAEFDEDEAKVIQDIHEVYGEFTAIELSAMCNRPHSPWAVTRRDHCRAIIPNELIEVHHGEIMEP